MVKDRVRVKEPNPLQKPRVFPRFRMAQSGQGRQRLKIFLPFDWTRKKSLFFQPKSKAGVGHIRFLVRQNLDFHPAPYATYVRVWVSHLRYHPYLLDCCQSKYGGLAFLLLLLFHRRCHPDLLGCCQSKVVDRAPPLLLLFHRQCHPYLLNCCWSKIEDLSFPCTLFFFSQLLLQACLSLFIVLCILYLSNKKTILFHFVYPFFSTIIVL